MAFKIGGRKPQTDAEIKQYFDYWNDLLPTDTDFVSRAIPLAQFAHESAWSTSELARNANNHAGHKFKGDDGWDKKRQYIKDAEEEDEKGNKYIIPDTGWRKYNSDKEFAEHHAGWLSRTPSYSKIYEKALNAKTWQEQLRALQGTYALDSKYYELVKNYIERYNLTQYDAQKGNDTMSFPRPKIIDRRKQALGYPGRGVYARRNKSAIRNIVWHYTATKREGNGATIIQNHERYWRNTHGWDIGGYHYYIDRQGNIFWNYDLEIATYGAGKANPYSMHISLEASSVSNYTAAQIKAREDLTLWLITSELPHLGGNSMRGHKEMPGNSTSCPGYSVAQLNEFRKGLSRKADQDWNGAETDKDDITVSKSGKYTVNHGDTLWAIAQAHGQTVAQLQEWNGIADGQWLKTGQVVYVTAPKQNSYTVKKGDSLWAIGQMHDVTVDQIKEWNDLKTNLIYSGQELFVSDPDAKNVKDPEPEQEVEKVEEQPKEDNPKVPAIELKENQLMDWKGNIYARISK